jgi:hypothetical protein
MKTKQIVLELIILVLVLNFFYEAVYKIAYLTNYSFWLHQAPFLKPIWAPLTYIIPLGEIGLASGLLAKRYRIAALYSVIIVSIVFIAWTACAHAFTNRIFYPYHALWKNPSWMAKMLISLVLSWLALLGIILENSSLKQIYGGTFSPRDSKQVLNT